MIEEGSDEWFGFEEKSFGEPVIFLELWGWGLAPSEP